MNILPIPNYPWIDRLTRGCLVWLVKEKQYAVIKSERDPKSNEIGIQIDDGSDRSWISYCDVLGRGCDGSQLFAPVKGDLPITEVVIQHLFEKLDQQEQRIKDLEKRLN